MKLLKKSFSTIQNSAKFIYEEGEPNGLVLPQKLDSFKLEKSAFSLDHMEIKNGRILFAGQDLTKSLGLENLKTFNIGYNEIVFDENDNAKIIFHLKNKNEKEKSFAYSIPVEIKNTIIPDFNWKKMTKVEVASDELLDFDELGNIFTFKRNNEKVKLNGEKELDILGKNYNDFEYNQQHEITLPDNGVLVFIRDYEKTVNEAKEVTAIIFDKQVGNRLYENVISDHNTVYWNPENDLFAKKLDKNNLLQKVNEVNVENLEITDVQQFGKEELVGITTDLKEIKIIDSVGDEREWYKVNNQNAEKLNTNFTAKNGMILATTNEGKIIFGDEDFPMVASSLESLKGKDVFDSDISPNKKHYVILHRGEKTEQMNVVINGQTVKKIVKKTDFDYSVHFINDNEFVVRGLSREKNNIEEFKGKVFEDVVNNDVKETYKKTKKQVADIVNLLNEKGMSVADLAVEFASLKERQEKLNEKEQQLNDDRENDEQFIMNLQDRLKKATQENQKLKIQNINLESKNERLKTLLKGILEKAKKSGGRFGRKVKYTQNLSEEEFNKLKIEIEN